MYFVIKATPIDNTAKYIRGLWPISENGFSFLRIKYSELRFYAQGFSHLYILRRKLIQ